MAERESELTLRVRDRAPNEAGREPDRPREREAEPEPRPARSRAEAIRQDIDATRHRLDQTIDTLQLRMSPRYLTQQTMDKIKYESSRAGHGFTHTLRENPLPAIVSGVGLAWLIGASVRRGRQEQPSHDIRRGHMRGPRDAELQARQSLYEAGMETQGTAYPPPGSYQSYGEGESEGGSQARQMGEKAKAYGEQAREKAQAYGEQAREKAGEYGHRAAETASHLRDRASELGHQFSERAGEMGHQLSERASEMGHHLREQASHGGERLRAGTKQAGESARNLFNEHPISVGLGILATGLAAGLLLPSTRKEDEMLGEQRDKLMDQAQAYGSELADRGRAVAERAGEAASEAASEEAHKQGMTGDGGGEEGSEPQSQQPS